MVYEHIPVGEVFEFQPEEGAAAWRKAERESEIAATVSQAFADMVKRTSRPAWLSHEPK